MKKYVAETAAGKLFVKSAALSAWFSVPNVLPHKRCRNACENATMEMAKMIKKARIFFITLRIIVTNLHTLSITRSSNS